MGVKEDSSSFQRRAGLWVASVLLVMVACLGAGAASSLAANELHASTYPTTLTSSQEAGFNHVFKIEGGLSTTCNTVSAHGSLTAASDVITLTPSFSGCTSFGLASTITAMGCDYSYEVGEELAADKFAASGQIVCEAGKAIKIVTVSCEVQIPAQTLTGSVELVNNTAASPKDVSVVSNLSGISYTKVKDGFLCPLNGTGAKTDGTTTGTQTLTGEDPGNPSFKHDLFVTD